MATSTSRPVLSAGFAVLAIQLQEAVAELSNGDVCKRLADALRDQCAGTGNWAYYIDHFGDAESGDVIYSCNGDTMRAPYAIAMVGGKSACTIDMEKAIDVVPRTIYEEEAEDEDHYVQMESERLYKSRTEYPLYERFIGKDERKSAGRESFAGKGKSFPILKPSDVMAAVRSIGRAGSDNYDAGTLKRNIIRIAKAKGWEKELPKAWRGDSEKTSESAKPEGGALKLVESSAFAVDMPLREAFGSGTKIKLIAPGKGSSAYYTAEVLKKAATDKIFKAGTPMRIDHPTSAQESERPEGSVKDWGAVLAKDAEWLDAHPQGPGLYSELKKFSDHATTIEEKGPYAGVSIRANGSAVIEAGKPVLREGVPLLKEFTSAEGVDMVTRAGAGGLFLQEAARSANTTQIGGEVDMDAAEIKQLQESLAAREADTKRLLERALRADARDFIDRELRSVTLHEAGKRLVTDAIMDPARAIPAKEGAIDESALKALVTAEAQRVGAVLAEITGSGQVRGMGAAAPPPVDAKEAERRAADEKTLRESAVKSFMALGMPKEAAERAADKEAA